MKNTFIALSLLLATALSASAAQVRDLVMVSGARDNQLVGYGLVAGLAGDGDLALLLSDGGQRCDEERGARRDRSERSHGTHREVLLRDAPARTRGRRFVTKASMPVASHACKLDRSQ